MQANISSNPSIKRMLPGAVLRGQSATALSATLLLLLLRMSETLAEPNHNLQTDHYPSFQLPLPATLSYDFYRETCPDAEDIIRSTVADLYSLNPSIAPALLRLVFHDCFIRGCDASVLLHRTIGLPSERDDATPGRGLRGFDAIDSIKFKLEAACPATVSCADILVLAARDGVVLAGGPYYPLPTGRRDSPFSFYSEANAQIPSPNGTFTDTLSAFATRGFTDRETVALLGAHSFGTVHCKFFQDRLYNFNGTGEPDRAGSPEFVAEMRTVCGGDPNKEVGLGKTREEAEAEERRGGEVMGEFDGHFYSRLLAGKGLLFSDQHLVAGRTVRWVWQYGAAEGGAAMFRKDFSRAMAKLSSIGGGGGRVRTWCSVAA